MIFAPSTNQQAYLKAGFMGFTGAGKTYTASLIARGLHQLCRDRDLPAGKSPVMFLDTETGSDWVRNDFAAEGVELHTAKTRAFSDLVPAVQEVAKLNGILIIDSISHFWRELTESYAKQKRRTRLLFQDWAWLKGEWGKFTDQFVNAPCHIIMCGRAGYEYDFFEDEAGKKELEKTGVKMKAETETGYEPSILVLMTRQQKFDPAKPQETGNVRYATVLKDRGRSLDGARFENPSFEDFLPHIEQLNLGGRQLGVDTERTSEHMVPPDSGEGKLNRERKAIALDEIKELMVKHYPGQSADAKKHKGNLLEKFFGTRSWVKVESLGLTKLIEGRDSMWEYCEGAPYGIQPQEAMA